MMRGRSLTVLACVALAGCKVGPSYTGAPRTIEADHHFARAAAITTTTAPSEAWWTALGDGNLDALERTALGNNPDIAASMARVREARADLHAEQAKLRPTTSTSALYLHTHEGNGLYSGFFSGGNAAESQAFTQAIPTDLDLYDAGFDATWQVDLFGGQRRAAEAAAATEAARRADLADARLTLTADVARAYVALRGAQHRLALAEQDTQLETRLLDLERGRALGGTASALDVERIATQVDQARLSIVPLQATIDAERDQLALLTGQVPGALDASLGTGGALPMPPASVSVGDPASLLRHRPDIRVAERELASANATIGQHVADYFPKLELLGNLGFSSTDISQLFNANAFSAVVAPVLSWKPFDWGRTRAAVEQARAARDEAEAHYRKTVLGALEDAETALSRYGHQRQDVAEHAELLRSASHAAELGRQRFAAGTATLIDTLDTERQRIDAEQSLAQSEQDLTTDFVALEKSLGLGWE